MHKCTSTLSVTQSCPTLCDPMDCNLPGFSVPGISQARMLEQVVISSSRGSSPPRDLTHISCIGRQILYHYATWEAPCLYYFSWSPVGQSQSQDQACSQRGRSPHKSLYNWWWDSLWALRQRFITCSYLAVDYNKRLRVSTYSSPIAASSHISTWAPWWLPLRCLVTMETQNHLAPRVKNVM